MWLCATVYMCICVWVTVYMWICVYVYMCVSHRVYVYMDLCVYVCEPLCIWVYVYMCVSHCVYVFMCICMWATVSHACRGQKRIWSSGSGGTDRVSHIWALGAEPRSSARTERTLFCWVFISLSFCFYIPTKVSPPPSPPLSQPILPPLFLFRYGWEVLTTNCQNFKPIFFLGFIFIF